MSAIVVYITAANRAEAHRLGKTLLAERLVACVNVVGPISSHYWWQGKIESAREMLVLAKTRAGLAAAVIQRVRTLHSYAVPCVVTLPIHKGNPDFLRWIEAETAVRHRRVPSSGRVRRAGRSGSGNTAGSAAR